LLHFSTVIFPFVSFLVWALFHLILPISSASFLRRPITSQDWLNRTVYSLGNSQSENRELCSRNREIGCEVGWDRRCAPGPEGATQLENETSVEARRQHKHDTQDKGAPYTKVISQSEWRYFYRASLHWFLMLSFKSGVYFLWRNRTEQSSCNEVLETWRKNVYWGTL
jgi:hypothetical protein